MPVPNEGRSRFDAGYLGLYTVHVHCMLVHVHVCTCMYNVPCTEVEAPDRCLLLEQEYRKRVINEDLEDLSVPQSH